MKVNPNGYSLSSQTLVEMTLFVAALLVLDALLIAYLIYPSVRRAWRRITWRTPPKELK